MLLPPGFRKLRVLYYDTSAASLLLYLVSNTHSRLLPFGKCQAYCLHRDASFATFRMNNWDAYVNDNAIIQISKWFPEKLMSLALVEYTVK